MTGGSLGTIQERRMRRLWSATHPYRGWLQRVLFGRLVVQRSRRVGMVRLEFLEGGDDADGGSFGERGTIKIDAWERLSISHLTAVFCSRIPTRFHRVRRAQNQRR
jgi:hypothetical protein